MYAGGAEHPSTTTTTKSQSEKKIEKLKGKNQEK